MLSAVLLHAVDQFWQNLTSRKGRPTNEAEIAYWRCQTLLITALALAVICEVPFSHSVVQLVIIIIVPRLATAADWNGIQLSSFFFFFSFFLSVNQVKIFTHKWYWVTLFISTFFSSVILPCGQYQQSAVRAALFEVFELLQGLANATN